MKNLLYPEQPCRGNILVPPKSENDLCILIALVDFLCHLFFFKIILRHSKWNHTRIFSDFGDEDSDDHDDERAMTKTIGRQTKASRPGTGTGISSVRY